MTPQATNSHPGLLIRRAISAETMKIPDPIIVPITIIVASNRFRPRTNPVFSGAWAGTLWLKFTGNAAPPLGPVGDRLRKVQRRPARSSDPVLRSPKGKSAGGERALHAGSAAPVAVHLSTRTRTECPMSTRWPSPSSVRTVAPSPTFNCARWFAMRDGSEAEGIAEPVDGVTHVRIRKLRNDSTPGYRLIREHCCLNTTSRPPRGDPLARRSRGTCPAHHIRRLEEYCAPSL